MNSGRILAIAFLSALGFGACQSTSGGQSVASATQETMQSDFTLPSIPPAKLFQHPTPQIMSLDNGLAVWYVHNPMVPLMSMRVVFPRGASTDPADKAGRASFAAAMMKEGAGGHTAQEVSDSIEFLGASIEPLVTNDNVGITVQSMTQFFPQTLDILAQMWLHPDFAPDAFERLRKIVLNNLKQRADNPGTVSKLAANRAYFGDNHPYGRSVDGYASTVAPMRLDDVRAAYDRLFAPGNAAFIAVGDMPADEFRALLNERFGHIEITGTAVPEEADFPAPREAVRRVVIVDKPGAPQTVIRIYQPAIEATSMKTLSWQFVNIPFGSSFTSRLMQNIREDKGYSYGAGSGIMPQRHAGVLVSSASVATDVTGPALHEFLYELDRLPKGDFTQEEFERARETWKSELVQSFETQAGVLGTVAGLYINGKPLDAINGFARSLADYDLAKFNGIAREFPTPDAATIVLVGDKGAILEQIRDLGLPEPEFRDADGKSL